MANGLRNVLRAATASVHQRLSLAAGPVAAQAARCLNTQQKNDANFSVLTPLGWLERAAVVWHDAPAVSTEYMGASHRRQFFAHPPTKMTGPVIFFIMQSCTEVLLFFPHPCCHTLAYCNALLRAVSLTRRLSMVTSLGHGARPTVCRYVLCSAVK